jgi:DNA-binding SARP family transcriptional activator
MPIEFRILGPLEVGADGRLLPLGSPKQRALLGLLLVHANETVARDRLIEELWAETTPASVQSALHVYLSRLRRLLEAAGAGGALVREAHGYRLRVEPAQLDANRFEVLVGEGSEALAAGKADVAAERLREALALWRGPAFADLQSERFAITAGARLEERRLSAVEKRLEADLALGGDRELISELETLVAEHPYRERLRAQLMLALYRSGRQVEALRVYRETRRTLADELGLEPGKELKELEQAILRQDESIAASPLRGSRVAEPVEGQPTQRAREVRKVVTVVFSDVVSSTELGETTDPEAVRRVMFRWYKAMAEELHAEANGALEAFEHLGDHAGLARAWELVADVHARDGKVSASQAALERAIREARKSGDLRLELRAETEMTSFLLHGPTAIDDAVAQTERALARARDQGDLSSVGYLVGRLARLYAARGQFAEARMFHAEARSLAKETGAGHIFHGYHLALIEMLAGNPDAAEKAIRPELDALRKTGDKQRFAIHANVLGRVLCAQRRYDEAEDLSRESEQASAPDELINQVGWRVVRARVFASRGQLGSAEPLAREAITLAASGEYVESHANALICLGEILDQAERAEEATCYIDKARRLWERKGNIISAGNARALLDKVAVRAPLS